MSAWTVLHQLKTCENGCESYEHQCEVMWRRLLEREAIERRHLEDQMLLDRRRDLENAIDPTVPRTLKGPDARTESERTAHEITHLPTTPWCETCVLKRVIETPHGRHTTSDSLRQNVTRGQHRLRACNIGRNTRSHRLPCKLSGRFREIFVCWEV